MTTPHVRVTETRDSSGWRRVRCGVGEAEMSLILDDHRGNVCLIGPWVRVENIPNLIAALEAAAVECDLKPGVPRAG
jgi:hypothetical protein